MCVLLLVLKKYGSVSWYMVSFIDEFLSCLPRSKWRDALWMGGASHRTLHMLGCGRMMDNNVYITRAINRHIVRE